MGGDWSDSPPWGHVLPEEVGICERERAVRGRDPL
jgi:hypothetical protein